MSGRPIAEFSLTHQFEAREARDHFEEPMDRAENGGAVVVRRRTAMVLVDRDALDGALTAQCPFDVNVSTTGRQTSMWIDGVPVHGEDDSYAGAEDDFLDALVSYAEEWVEELRFVPNHRANAPLVARVLMYAGDREELRCTVFGDE